MRSTLMFFDAVPLPVTVTTTATLKRLLGTVFNPEIIGTVTTITVAVSLVIVAGVPSIVTEFWPARKFVPLIVSEFPTTTELGGCGLVDAIVTCVDSGGSTVHVRNVGAGPANVDTVT